MSHQGRLDARSIAKAAKELAKRDPVLNDVHRLFGTPPAWSRPGTFATLARIILEQQVSLDSAKAVWDRLTDAAGGRLSPESVTELGESRIRLAGVTRQKTRYLLSLSEDILAGVFSIRSLAYQDEFVVRQRITSRLGMGDWTADIYLLLVLMRPDVLPVGDLAFVKGVEELDRTTYSSREELIRRAEVWRPYRSVATRMVWQQYVYNRGRNIP